MSDGASSTGATILSDAGIRWTQDFWEQDGTDHGRGVLSRNNRLAWIAIIVLAVITFELTANPVLSTALGCLKFGWGELREARWLIRTDPDRRRGRICSQFYLAWGLWRVSLVATAIFFLVAFAAVFHERAAGRAPANNDLPPPAMTAMILAMAGFSASALISAWAVASASRHRLKVWVGPEARWAREDNVWPPQEAPRRRATENRAKAILFSAVLTAVAFCLLFLLIGSLAWLFGDRPPAWLALVVTILPMLILPIAVLGLMDYLGRRVIANSPGDCWNAESAVFD